MHRPSAHTLAPSPAHHRRSDGQRSAPIGKPLLAAVTVLALALGGCRLSSIKAIQLELVRQGHAATVDCLQAERAITGGDELRCEDWDYVRQNHLWPSN